MNFIGIFVCLFFSPQILSAGSLACMNHWMLTGQLKSSIPCSPTSVFSLNINKRSDASKVRFSKVYTTVCKPHQEQQVINKLLRV